MMDEELFPLVFDGKKKNWHIKVESNPLVKKDTLRLATFNIWFGNHYFEERVMGLLNLLKKTDAEIIGLQEVTPTSLQMILDNEWIRAHYYVSDNTGDTVLPYGVILLSRIPMKRMRLHELPSWMDRRVLIAEFRINGQEFHVGTVHLESLKSASVRAEQLYKIFYLLEKAPHAVLMGDFNFCSSWEENSNIDRSYKDMWAVLRNDSPGYTEDTDINLMRLLIKKKEKRVRFDRILIRSNSTPGWKPKKIQLIGTEPVSPEFPLVFPSDHFGLVGEIGF